MLLTNYLDIAKRKTGSDYATAKAMGVGRAAVSLWRKRGSLDNENAFKLAKMIEVEPAEIIAASEAAKNPEKAQFWRPWIAASVILSLGAAIYLVESSTLSYTIATDPLYIMRAAVIMAGAVTLVYFYPHLTRTREYRQ